MALEVQQCPTCHKKFRVPSESSATRVLCPHCRQVIPLEKRALGFPKELTSSEPLVRAPGAVPDLVPETIGPSSGAADSATLVQSANEIIVSDPVSNRRVAPNSFPGLAARGGGAGAGDSIAGEPESSARPDGVAVTEDSAENASPSETPHDGPAQNIENESPSELAFELRRLLPPKFVVASPLEAQLKALGGRHVILPDAAGGFRAIDDSVRRIQMKGGAIAISALPPRIKRRRRMIRGAITFVLCAALLLAAIYWLNSGR
jgi:hypothetical protein